MRDKRERRRQRQGRDYQGQSFTYIQSREYYFHVIPPLPIQMDPSIDKDTVVKSSQDYMRKHGSSESEINVFTTLLNKVRQIQFLIFIFLSRCSVRILISIGNHGSIFRLIGRRNWEIFQLHRRKKFLQFSLGLRHIFFRIIFDLFTLQNSCNSSQWWTGNHHGMHWTEELH